MDLPDGAKWREIDHVSYVAKNGSRTYRCVRLMSLGWRLTISDEAAPTVDGVRTRRKVILSEFVKDIEHAEKIIWSIKHPECVEIHPESLHIYQLDRPKGL